MRNGDSHPARGLEEAHSLFGPNLPAINGQSNFSHVCLSLLIFTAENAEELLIKKQNPRSILITKNVFPFVFNFNTLLGALCGETWTPVSTGVTTFPKNIMLIRQFFCLLLLFAKLSSAVSALSAVK